MLFQVLAMCVLFSLSSRLLKRQLTAADGACAVFCGVHKSLTLGIPILKVRINIVHVFNSV